MTPKTKANIIGLTTAGLACAALIGLAASNSPASGTSSPAVSVVDTVDPSPSGSLSEVSLPALAPSFSPSPMQEPVETWTTAVESPPASDAPVMPQGPEPIGTPHALCNDGTTSYSTHDAGTCSHHGGVKVWYWH